MATSTVEDYLKQLYLEQQQPGNSELVPMGKLANAMGVVPGTATSMVKALADSGLVTYEPRSERYRRRLRRAEEAGCGWQAQPCWSLGVSWCGSSSRRRLES